MQFWLEHGGGPASQNWETSGPDRALPKPSPESAGLGSGTLAQVTRADGNSFLEGDREHAARGGEARVCT
jgi:hypothetical protein